MTCGPPGVGQRHRSASGGRRRRQPAGSGRPVSHIDSARTTYASISRMGSSRPCAADSVFSAWWSTSPSPRRMRTVATTRSGWMHPGSRAPASTDSASSTAAFHRPASRCNVARAETIHSRATGRSRLSAWARPASTTSCRPRRLPCSTSANATVSYARDASSSQPTLPGDIRQLQDSGPRRTVTAHAPDELADHLPGRHVLGDAGVGRQGTRPRGRRRGRGSGRCRSWPGRPR